MPPQNMDMGQPKPLPLVNITDKKDPTYPGNVLATSQCLIMNQIINGAKSTELLAHVRDQDFNVQIFKVTLDKNNIFYFGIVFFVNKDGGYDIENMTFDKDLENLFFLYGFPPIPENKTPNPNLLADIQKDKIKDICLANSKGNLSTKEP